MTSCKILSSSFRPLTTCLFVKPTQFNNSFAQIAPTTVTTLRNVSHCNDFYYKRAAELSSSSSSRSLESLAVVKSHLIHPNSTCGLLVVTRKFSQLTSVTSSTPTSHKYSQNNNMTMKLRSSKNNDKNLSNDSVLSFSTNSKTKQEEELKDIKEKTENSSSTVSSSSSATTEDSSSPPPTISRKEQLKKAVKDYGATVIVFHVTMSLCSLGFFYLLVSSGLDVVAVLDYLGVGKSILESKITQGSTTFVVAYAVHKVFAPVRITITLTAVPFIVKYLRNAGILKKAVK